jgi:hypothetical protein
MHKGGLKQHAFHLLNQVIDGKQQLNRKTAKDVLLGVKHEFDSRRSWFKRIVGLMKKVMAFIFFKVVYR